MNRYDSFRYGIDGDRHRHLSLGITICSALLLMFPRNRWLSRYVKVNVDYTGTDDYLETDYHEWKES